MAPKVLLLLILTGVLLWSLIITSTVNLLVRF